MKKSLFFSFALLTAFGTGYAAAPAASKAPAAQKTPAASKAPAAPKAPVSKQELVKKYRMTQTSFTQGGEKLLYCRREIGDWSKPGKAPVVLFFHGAGERGADNAAPLFHGAKELTAYCEKHNLKALLLFPQCPDRMQWVDTPWSAPAHKLPPESRNMRLAMAMLDKELKNPNVDPDRVYVTGLSMGGFGTWDAVSRYPEKFAAAFPICGGADLEQAPKLVHLPILVYHGDSDTIVLTKRSREMVKAIRDAGGKKITYVEVPNCGHGSWFSAFRTEANWQWLFAQRRARNQ